MKPSNDSRYDDIIHLPHHVSSVHPQMSLQNRAAQFSPFAALTGYEEQVNESARLTGTKQELSENMKELLDEKLQMIQKQLETETDASHTLISVTYFQPDVQKEGGEYVTFSGLVKKIDPYERKVIFYPPKNAPYGEKRMAGPSIAIDDILEIAFSDENKHDSIYPQEFAPMYQFFFPTIRS